MQPIPKFSTTLNGHPVFIPAMVWHLPENTLPQAAEALRTIDEHAFDGRGVCWAADNALELYTECSLDVYNWVGAAVCYFDHTRKQVEETWLTEYFKHRFGLRWKSVDVREAHYTREQISALRLAWLRHIITYLEAAAK